MLLVLPSCQVAMSIFSSLWDWDLSSWLLTCSLAETCFFVSPYHVKETATVFWTREANGKLVDIFERFLIHCHAVFSITYILVQFTSISGI